MVFNSNNNLNLSLRYRSASKAAVSYPTFLFFIKTGKFDPVLQDTILHRINMTVGIQQINTAWPLWCCWCVYPMYSELFLRIIDRTLYDCTFYSIQLLWKNPLTSYSIGYWDWITNSFLLLVAKLTSYSTLRILPILQDCNTNPFISNAMAKEFMLLGMFIALQLSYAVCPPSLLPRSRSAWR